MSRLPPPPHAPAAPCNARRMQAVSAAAPRGMEGPVRSVRLQQERPVAFARLRSSGILSRAVLKAAAWISHAVWSRSCTDLDSERTALRPKVHEQTLSAPLGTQRSVPIRRTGLCDRESSLASVQPAPWKPKPAYFGSIKQQRVSKAAAATWLQRTKLQ